MDTQVGRTKKAKAMLKRSPMQLQNFDYQNVREALQLSQEQVDQLRFQLYCLFPTFTYAEAYDYLLTRFAWKDPAGLVIYRGGHHIAVHAQDGGPCLFRAVEVFPS